MSDRFFSQLAPFIQEYIYQHNWMDFQPIQVAASEVIFNTDAHLLIAAGTAAGKTEAAFLPILTLLHQQPSHTIAVLYISPIKALINDQFERLSDLLKDGDMPVCCWHGDALAAPKKQLLKDPRGILQITPESLESILINHSDKLQRLFGDLRFIVIDEMHLFAGTDRGSQILCQLARIARATNREARRIGLSATLGDRALAANWLQSGSAKEVIAPDASSKQRQIRLAIEHFYQDNANDTEEINPYYQYIFDLTKGKKCLIFANNRAETELVISNLRQIAAQEKLPDIYHVHHGSISAKLRADAEAAMRQSRDNSGDRAAVIAATVTLELGIDLGQLERVIQLGSPLSVASFLQRLGRTGRRGNAADMRFVCTEAAPTGEESILEQIPWQLLQCIAIIQLYLEERWIEPIQPVKYPFSLLYHQTLSILAATGEMPPPELAKQVLTLPPFAAISQAEFRQLLQYLISIDHLQTTETGKLIIGITGEKIVRNFQFYAVFAAETEYTVRDEDMEIGAIASPPPGKLIALAGRTWQILDIDWKNQIVYVKAAPGEATISWRGRSSNNIHTKILQRMRQALLEKTNYSYLQANAIARLQAARSLAQDLALDKNYILPLSDRKCCIIPWMGSIAYRTLERWINCCRESLKIKSIGGQMPYYLTVETSDLKSLRREILSLRSKPLTALDLVAEAEAIATAKYDEFIPQNLQRQAISSDCLNVTELQELLKKW